LNFQENLMLGIIGGSGLTQLANLDVSHREVVRTPWGEPSAPLSFGSIGKQQVIFLARHGHGHSIPPHLVNYRANIDALKRAGATRVISVASVGGIRADMGPGVLLVPKQIIDYTWGREMSFQHADAQQVVHIDFTEPYDSGVRKAILDAARQQGEAVIDGGIYAATQGPRLETAAEINRLERDGVDVVGMTGMPEAGLAREAELPYGALCVVANWAAGRADSKHEIRFEHIEATLQLAMGRVRRIIERFCVDF
jgi:5'-deoxy-5'-methylthioadenosine phosphorylase